MTNLIVGQCALYVVQNDICNICYDLSKSTECECAMHVLSWFIVILYYCTMYYVYTRDVRDSTYRVIEWTKIYHTLFDCLCSCYIDPVQRTKVND